MSDRATRSSWKISHPSGPSDLVDYADTFSSAEFDEIKRGLVPRDMDDKWFIFFEDPILYLHRSWTGSLIFKVELLPLESGARVSRAEVIRDPEIRQSNEVAAKLLAWLIRGLLLRQEVPFPDLLVPRHPTSR